MLVEAILKPTTPGQKIWFTPYINEKNGKKWVITEDFEVIPKEKMTEHTKPLDIRFNDEKVDYRIKWDNESSGGFDTGRQRVVEFIALHEQVKPLFGEKDNPNLRGNPLFTIEFTGNRNTATAKIDMKKVDAHMKFRALKPVEKRECAFYYGINATGMTTSLLMTVMAGLQSGKLLDSNPRPDGELSYLDHFLTKYEAKGDMEVETIARKAMIAKLIEKGDKGYMYQKDFMGTDLPHVIEYLKDNDSVYQYIKKEVNKGNEVEDDLSMAVEVGDKFIVPVKLDLAQEFKDKKEMQEIATAFGIYMARNKGVEKNTKEVDAVCEKYGLKNWRNMPLEAIRQKVDEYNSVSQE